MQKFLKTSTFPLRSVLPSESIPLAGKSRIPPFGIFSFLGYLPSGIDEPQVDPLDFFLVPVYYYHVIVSAVCLEIIVPEEANASFS